MSHRCQECNRLNPRDAAFCYYDGAALNGQAAASQGSSIDFSTWSFPNPFVFPTGEKCRNFLQLALACHRDPKSAIEVMRAGYLESFFGTFGRMDLAMLARACAQSPDPERALDDLLGKMPGSPLRPAELRVEPVEIQLGLLQVGEDRRLDVVLSNQGDRLIYGKALLENCPWLSLGEGNAAEKIVQLTQKMVLPVHVRGKHLRAYHKPQKAEITVETNGGNFLVTVELTVPVKPFPEGVLSGAMSPRQLAEKAKAHPKEAAVLIENGAVARWYESNGWPYPVQGPTASGIAAVQQLFEVLGLVKTPKVEVSESSITLRGNPGDRLEYVLTALTHEKRAAVAHGSSNQPWLTIGRTVFRGQMASLPLLVESVPEQPGQTLSAVVKVTANGNQRFDVPVQLLVGSRSGAHRAVAATPAPVPAPSAPPAPVPVPAVPPPAPAPAVEAALAAATIPPAPIAPPPPPPAEPDPNPLVFENPTAVPAAVAPEATPALAPPAKRDGIKLPWAMLLPVAIVAVGLLVALVRDLLVYEPPPGEVPEIDYANPRLDLRFHDHVLPGDFLPAPTMRFGIGIPDPKDPKKLGTKLVYDEYGRTCNVCVFIDAATEYLWGVEQGQWKGPVKEPMGKDLNGQRIIGARSTWSRTGPPFVTITQYVEVVPGGLSADGSKRLLDTCLVHYHITNDDSIAHTIGLRFLLDTFIGSNDAVPFTLAGSSELCNTKKEFNKPEEVPDFISALERQDLKNPGTVAHLSLKYGGDLEAPTRVTLGGWPVGSLRKHTGDAKPQGPNTRWDVPVLPMALSTSAENPDGDSAVTLYWDEKKVPPRETRRVGFAYGLGSISGDKGEGQLGLTAGGELVSGKEFTLTAYVKNPAPGTTITLSLPRGLERVSGKEKEAVPPVPPGSASPYSPVMWRVKAVGHGIIPVKVTLSTGATLRHRLVIDKAKKVLD